MENYTTSNSELSLKEAFSKIVRLNCLSDHVTDIAEHIYSKGFDRPGLNKILKEYGIKSEQDIKEELLDLLLIYVNIALNDHRLTEAEMLNVRSLKRLLKIKEGELVKYRYEEIEEVLGKEFWRLYLDNKVDNEEALFSIGLQEMFDLSYDQFEQFKQKQLKFALEQGADIAELDTINDLNSLANASSGRSLSNKLKNIVWDRDGGKCSACGSIENLEFSHVIPLSKGGYNTYRNVRLLCSSCNRK